jgi:hypothetical protein
MFKLIRNNRGEGYIDVVISVLVSTMLLVLAINLFSFLTIKQDMDYYSKEMCFVATANGRTIGEVDLRKSELTEQTGISPETSWETSYFNATSKTVQYGDSITVTLTYQTYFKGFGVLRIPITLTTKYSGLSMKYWK